MPRGWPSHGYDRRNTRATPLETTLVARERGALVLKWDLDCRPRSAAARTASAATPAVGNGNVYVSSWNGFVVAAKQTNGGIKWTYDTQSRARGS